MGYNIYNLRGGSYDRKSSDVRDFYEAMDMAKEGMDRICQLAEEMMHQYGERRHDFDERYDRREEHWDDGMRYEERRRRDSMGRYR